MSYESYAALLARMHALEDPAYRSFMSRLIPGCENLRGIRMPALRRLAKDRTLRLPPLYGGGTGGYV